MYIEIEHAGKTFYKGSESFRALDDVSLNIEKGEFICLLGPSGCGKSTLLNALAGFDTVDEGSIKIDGVDVSQSTAKRVTIFQNYGLLPWRTVSKNVQLGLETKKLTRDERNKIADKYLELVGLSAFKNSHPNSLSGGMQQRVAVARALAADPQIIFMDEPFGALDAITRMKLQEDILRISKEQKKTIIFVTHDIEEAVFLGDRIVVMTANPGKIKSIVPVRLRNSHDRTGDDFIAVRDKIFEIFNMKSEESIEYNI